MPPPQTVPSTPLTPTTLSTDPHTYLHSTLYARKQEYLTPTHARIKVGTWNVASLAVERDVRDWIRECEGERLKARHSYHAKHKKRASRTITDLLAGAKEQLKSLDMNSGKEDWTAEGAVDIYVLALQEIVDVSAPENYLRPIDPKIPLNWKSHTQAALPAGYKLIASPQLIGVLLLVYASPRIFPHISSVSTSTVGTGLMGYVGNKGAAGVRIVLGETTRLVIVNCHLAAFQNGVDRRNWDHQEVIRRMTFEKVKRDVLAGFPPDGNIMAPQKDDPETLEKSDLIIWCGDLNYRVDLPNDEIRTALEPFLPQEFPPTIPSEGPSSPASYKSPKAFTFPSISAVHEAAESMESTIKQLLNHDQLYNQQKLEKSFAGYKEGKITFLPTYKYDVGTLGVWDSSEKQRAPAFCDRVLWKMRDEDEMPPTPKLENAAPKEGENGFVEIDTDSHSLSPPKPVHQNRPRATTLTVEDEDGEDLIVSSDTVIRHAPPPPEGEEEEPLAAFPQNTTISTSAAADLRLNLITYTSHQSSRSSDHKPVTAVFSLKFPCVNDELKSEVYAAVAKEVDRIENERRPVVTIIIDREGETPTDEVPEHRDEDMNVSLGNVQLNKPVEKKLTIANTGLVPAKCLFRKRPIIDEDFGDEKEAICKAWLDVDFDEEHSNAGKAITQGVTLEPGEVVTVYLNVNVEVTDLGFLHRLNHGDERLDDILVLHVEGGRDIFLPVSGTWMQSCFGRTMQELVTIPEGAGGARAVFASVGKRNNKKENSDESKNLEPLYSAPRELYRITEYLMNKVKDIVEDDIEKPEGVESQRWYSEIGWPFAPDTWGLQYDDDIDDEDASTDDKTPLITRRKKLLIEIEEALSMDKEFPFDKWALEDGYTQEDIIEVIAESLIQFLSSLKGRVIPSVLYDVVMKGGQSGAEKVLESLPTAASSVHANVFIYLTGFISEMISTLTPPVNNSKSDKEIEAGLAGDRKSLSQNTNPSTSTSIKSNPRSILLKQKLAAVFSEVMVDKPLSAAPPALGRNSLTSGKIGEVASGGRNRDSVLSIVSSASGVVGGAASRRSDDEKKREFLVHFLQF
ncbi:Endonuclease/exonuclease/phosphatase [Peziza echinospora]|nr:Endonuclease/exonuclease/phosphatase [Peziza echinospora]